MKLHITKKEWDSNFFGYRIAEVKSKIFKRGDLNFILEAAKNDKINLLYLISNFESSDIESEGCRLADIKVTYRRSVDADVSLDDNIFLFSTADDYKKLLELSFNSGIYSRFKTDSNFRNNEFEKLYTEWIKKSVDRRLADAVFVYISDGSILGMVTVKVDDAKASIGLIAVNEESRGKKIGKKLIDTVNNYALNNGCISIEVPTQKQNSSACNFYEKNGFVVSSTDYIYHLWLKQSNENSI